MTQLFSNNAEATLSAGISSVDVTITLQAGDGALFNSPVNPDYELATLDGINGTEIVKITSRTADVLTVTRAQEGTSALAFLADEYIKGKITAGTLDSFAGGFDPNTDEIALATGAAATAATDSIAIGFNAASVGDSSVAIGKYSATGIGAINGFAAVGGTADGNASIAMGANAYASFSAAISIGLNSDANSIDSVAIGNLAQVLTTSDSSIAIGPGATVRGGGSIGIGHDADVGSGNTNSFAIGTNANTTGSSVMAFGYGAGGSGLNSIAFGTSALSYCTNGISIGPGALTGNGNNRISIGKDIEARVDYTHAIAGLSLVKKDDKSAGNELTHFCGQENLLFSDEFDFKQAAVDDVVSIPMEANSAFFVTEVGVVVTNANAVTVQPQFSFGITGSTALLVATVATTKSANHGRDIFASLNDDGQTSLTCSLKVSATATTMLGRVYFKGFLLEDE